MFSGSSARNAGAAVVHSPAFSRRFHPTGPEAQLSATASITLHLERLALNESVGIGNRRNIFSAESNVKIEEPVAILALSWIQLPPPPAKPPTLELKYFGYAVQRLDQGASWFEADIFMEVGEIVDHRYKVGAIAPGSVQITDLAYNNTQTVPLTAQATAQQ
jgi:hypothetical protein